MSRTKYLASYGSCYCMSISNESLIFWMQNYGHSKITRVFDRPFQGTHNNDHSKMHSEEKNQAENEVYEGTNGPARHSFTRDLSIKVFLPENVDPGWWILSKNHQTLASSVFGSQTGTTPSDPTWQQPTTPVRLLSSWRTQAYRTKANKTTGQMCPKIWSMENIWDIIKQGRWTD